MPISCHNVIEVMEELAPSHLAESWDNIGLLVGSKDQPVSKILVTLDVTPTVFKYAVSHNVDMIITHHPVIFKGVTKLETDTAPGELLAGLIRAGIAVYAAHTNLDTAPGGVNDVLAAKLGLTETRPLNQHSQKQLIKLVVYVPQAYVEPVRAAITTAGAGHIGNYSHCTFQTAGTGTFLPLAGTKPFLGTPGKLEYADEYRLETIVPAELLSQVLDMMFKAHPYEEVAYDLFPLLNAGAVYGLGRVGRLAATQSLQQVAAQVKSSLGLQHINVAGSSDHQVAVVAVCGGSGADLIEQAACAHADVYITGDIKYHEAQKAEALGLALIDAGHFGTEQPVVNELTKKLQDYADQHKWEVVVIADTFSKNIFNIW